MPVCKGPAPRSTANNVTTMRLPFIAMKNTDVSVSTKAIGGKGRDDKRRNMSAAIIAAAPVRYVRQSILCGKIVA